MWYRSIGLKLICSVGAIATFVISVHASVNIETQRDQFIQEVIRGANLVSETIKRGLREDMLTYHPERLHRTVESEMGVGQPSPSLFRRPRSKAIIRGKIREAPSD